MATPFFFSLRPLGDINEALALEVVDVELLVLRVQEVVSLLAALSAGLAVEVVLVKGRDLGVQVRHAKRALLVVGVKTRKRTVQ